MINGNGVHLPDTTYGGNTINWNCSSDSDDSLQRLKAENAKLRELCKAWRKFSYDLFDEFIGEPDMDDDFVELDDRMHELGVEVDA